jgi:hypothetical protein
MAQNFDVFDFILRDDDMARIAAMDTGSSQFFDHRDPAMATSSATSASTEHRGQRRAHTNPNVLPKTSPPCP